MPVRHRLRSWFILLVVGGISVGVAGAEDVVIKVVTGMEAVTGAVVLCVTDTGTQQRIGLGATGQDGALTVRDAKKDTCVVQVVADGFQSAVVSKEKGDTLVFVSL